MHIAYVIKSPWKENEREKERNLQFSIIILIPYIGTNSTTALACNHYYIVYGNAVPIYIIRTSKNIYSLKGAWFFCWTSHDDHTKQNNSKTKKKKRKKNNEKNLCYAQNKAIKWTVCTNTPTIPLGVIRFHEEKKPNCFRQQNRTAKKKYFFPESRFWPIIQ